MCAGGIDFVSSLNFSNRFWNCSDSGVFFIIHYTKSIPGLDTNIVPAVLESYNLCVYPFLNMPRYVGLSFYH
jgi:hypothetical protein